jgi:hypothetical protein
MAGIMQKHDNSEKILFAAIRLHVVCLQVSFRRALSKDR